MVALWESRKAAGWSDARMLGWSDGRMVSGGMSGWWHGRMGMVAGWEDESG